MKYIFNKIKNNSLFTFILGAVIFGSIGIYGANVYESTTIKYSPTDASWEVSNVDEAINSLHGMVSDLENIKTLGNATASQILSGKTAVVKGSAVTGTLSIPAASILKGKIVGGVSGTATSDATATASDIASGETAWVNGTKHTGTAYRAYTFNNKVATIKNTPYEFTGSWVNMGKIETFDCDSYGCNGSLDSAEFTIDLGIKPSEVLAINVSLTSNSSKYTSFRFGRGYGSGTTTAQYWYIDELLCSPRTIYKTTSSFYGDGFIIYNNTSSTTNIYSIRVALTTDGKLSFSVDTERGSATEGTTKSTFQTSGTEFYLSGSIIYK